MFPSYLASKAKMTHISDDISTDLPLLQNKSKMVLTALAKLSSSHTCHLKQKMVTIKDQFATVKYKLKTEVD